MGTQVETETEFPTASEPYFLVARDRLTYSLDQVDRIDAKLNLVISSGTIILPLTAGLLVRSPEEFGELPVLVVVLLIIASIAYSILFWFFYKGFQVDSWDDRPRMEQWRDFAHLYQPDVLYKWLGDGCIDAYGNNIAKLEVKSQKLKWAIRWLAAEVFFLVVAVLALLLS